MSRLIDINAVIRMLNTLDRYISTELTLCDTDKTFPKNEVFVVDDVYEGLEQLPSAESEIIHCKNCKHRDSDYCPMYYEEWIEIDEGDGYFDTDTIIHDWTTDEGFCHCAELRGKEE